MLPLLLAILAVFHISAQQGFEPLLVRVDTRVHETRGTVCISIIEASDRLDIYSCWRAEEQARWVQRSYWLPYGDYQVTLTVDDAIKDHAEVHVLCSEAVDDGRTGRCG